MARAPEISSGVVAVALKALSKKEFFQRLLEDPRAALRDPDLDLKRPDDEDAVVAMIEQAKDKVPPTEALRLWDEWRATGKWAGGFFWPMLGVFWPTRPPQPSR